MDISNLSLLVVDDNEINREVLTSQLQSWGATVSEAHSGPAALALCEKSVIEETLYDVVFLDMQMPKMDGEQLCLALSKDERFQSMKRIMMTSLSQRGDARHFADLGCSGYFPKPATADDLLDALAIVVQGGEVLKAAQPLVTRHYVKGLLHDVLRPFNGSFIIM